MSTGNLPADASFADLWPVRELGTWLVAVDQRRLETIHEAPFVKALGLWLRVLRDQNRLKTVGNAYGRHAWQIQGWNAFVGGSDDVIVRETLAELGHALHQGIVATEWSVMPDVDPSDSKAVASLHARIVSVIDAGDTDAAASPWHITDRGRSSTVPITFTGWRPRVSDEIWDVAADRMVPVVPVYNHTKAVSMDAGMLVVVDPADITGLETAIEIEGEDFDTSTKAGAQALAMETSKRFQLGLVLSDGAVDIFHSSERDILLLVEMGHRPAGYTRLGRIMPARGRVIIGDAATIASILTAHGTKEVGQRAITRIDPNDIFRDCYSLKVRNGTWMLAGDDMPPILDDKVIAVVRQFHPTPDRRPFRSRNHRDA